MIEMAASVESGTLKSCCADLWSHPGIRLLAGDTLRPGDLELTWRALSHLDLPAGDRVLDVGCGPGSTIGLLTGAGLRAFGVDYSQALAAEAGLLGPVALADAERLPFGPDVFDAVFIECVLSAVPDKRAALSEIRRVLRDDGVLALSDVVVDGPLPPPLDSVVGWVACAAGAENRKGYVELLEDAGLCVTLAEDHAAALTELLVQARRRLALLQGAMAAGLVAADPLLLNPGLVELGQELLGIALASVETGRLGYALMIARKAG
jgi:SAM-dependent methyltransferase